MATSTPSSAATPLQFTPFSSEIELPFYTALFASKLDHDRLDDSAKPVLGLYEPLPVEPSASGRMQVLGNALAPPAGAGGVPMQSVRGEGFIKNVNTLDEFRNTSRDALVQTAAKQIWDAINDGTIYSIPSLLSSFVILSYADLKRWKFYYWFAFPAIHSTPAWQRRRRSSSTVGGAPDRLQPRESESLVEAVQTWKYAVDSRERGFFLAKRVRSPPPPPTPTDDSGSLGAQPSAGAVDDVPRSSFDELGFRWVVASLREYETGFFNGVDSVDRFVCFVDPSTYPENPGWPLRNLLVLVRRRWRLNEVRVLCYRDTHARRHEARSVVMDLWTEPLPAEGEGQDAAEMPKVTGWERRSNGKLQPRVASLADYMDPARLADSAVDLNLKLMKWRLAPDLNLEAIRDAKCLLLGAGTLGGYVSRYLMAWGVRKITFVDYGKVSFSNPVRQPVFTFADSLNGGLPKATRAAEALREIYPGVQSEGIEMEVPMLGHPFTDEAKTKKDFERLKELVESHDAIFLLMDSRESRWLPTVMGKAAGKIVMNAALGFDSYVVMRHGAETTGEEEKGLGCYFCNDVVAPGDSTKDLTLDQQCTVTQPAVAGIASGLVVTILAALLQHPSGHKAPAPQISGGRVPERDPPEHPLGLVPHQIRGFLATFQQMVIRGEAYPSCSACSSPILAAYRADGWGFVRRALLEKEYVAEVSGLAEVQREAERLAMEMEMSLSEGEDEGEGELL